MPAFLWNPAWETGIAGVDDQHRELLHRMGVLSEHIAELSQHDVLPEVIETALYLRKYVEVHFGSEEALMVKTGYPGLEHHREVHVEMRRQLDKLIDAFLKDHKNLTFNLMEFLVTWLLDHINTHDREFGGFVRRQQVSGSPDPGA